MNTPAPNNTTDDRLEALLAASDPVSNAELRCAGGDELVRRVLNLSSRRRSRRRATGAVVAVAAAAVMSFVLVSNFRQSPPVEVAKTCDASPELAETIPDHPVAVEVAADTKEELTVLRGNIRRLRQEIKRPGREAKYRSRLAAMRRRVTRPDPLLAARQEVEKTAYILVARGVREEVAARPGADPAATYKQAMALFPGTVWAKVARSRLDNPLQKTEPLSGSTEKGQL